MAVVAGKIAGYVVVETAASGTKLGVHDDRVLAMQEAHMRDLDDRAAVSTLGVPPSTFKVFALVEVDEP